MANDHGMLVLLGSDDYGIVYESIQCHMCYGDRFGLLWVGMDMFHTSLLNERIQAEEGSFSGGVSNDHVMVVFVES